jgi:hypothetical protein
VWLSEKYNTGVEQTGVDKRIHGRDDKAGHSLNRKAGDSTSSRILERFRILAEMKRAVYSVAALFFVVFISSQKSGSYRHRLDGKR